MLREESEGITCKELKLMARVLKKVSEFYFYLLSEIWMKIISTEDGRRFDSLRAEQKAWSTHLGEDSRLARSTKDLLRSVIKDRLLTCLYVFLQAVMEYKVRLHQN